MKRKVIGLAILLLAVFAAFLLLYLYFRADWMKSCAITFGTFSYHFWMRLAVGFIIDRLMKNRADLKKAWYQPRKWEKNLYQRLRVKQWKQHIPTFVPESFSMEQHSADEIAQVMCQSEIVHEVIILLSFAPLLGAIPFGAFPVFLLTSIAAAMIDTVFVIVQRYNRPRVIRLAELQAQKQQKSSLTGEKQHEAE